MMPGVNYIIYGCSFVRTTPGGEYCCSYYSRQCDRWQFEKANENLKFLYL